MEETVLPTLVLRGQSQVAHQENPVRSEPGFLDETPLAKQKPKAPTQVTSSRYANVQDPARPGRRP